MFKTVTIPFLVLLFVVAPAWADRGKQHGHTVHILPVLDQDAWDDHETNEKVLVDDWQCSQTGWLKDVQLCGSWQNIDGGKTGDVSALEGRPRISCSIYTGSTSCTIRRARHWTCP